MPSMLTRLIPFVCRDFGNRRGRVDPACNGFTINTSLLITLVTDDVACFSKLDAQRTDAAGCQTRHPLSA